MSDPVIQVTNLKKRYGSTIADQPTTSPRPHIATVVRLDFVAWGTRVAICSAIKPSVTI